MALFFVGCVSTNIETLKNNPARYGGTEVFLAGEVTKAVNVPFTSLSVYVLKDRSGQIPVISSIERKSGDKVFVKYKVIAFDGDNMSKSGEDAVTDLKKYLEKEGILSGRAVDVASKGAVKVIQTLTSTATGTYFLVDIGKEK